jgi:cysteine desulfuration protein SufE
MRYSQNSKESLAKQPITKPAHEILASDARALFSELGLSEHLTPQRSNGFFSMVERIRRDAEVAAAG